MPIIQRIETDMFVFAGVCSYMVNPVNLVQAPGAGLALEFRKRAPNYVEPYRTACRTKDLRIGTVQVFEDTGQDWSMINLPTKVHYYDDSEKELIARGIEALRETLLKPQYRYASVGLPMLGCGLGNRDCSDVYPLIMDHLGDLDATIFLSMAPDKTELRPRYLGIAGPLNYAQTESEKHTITKIITAAMTTWGITLSDYTGIVSCGYPGVDSYIGGTDYRHGIEDTFVYRHTGKTPLVIKPDTVRHGVASNLYVGDLLCEIAEDIILFKPHGFNNNRMIAMQRWLEQDKGKRAERGAAPRRIAVYGDKGQDHVVENILVREDGHNSDDPTENS